MDDYQKFDHQCEDCKTDTVPVEFVETTGRLRSDRASCTTCGAKYSVRVERKGDHYFVKMKPA